MRFECDCCGACCQAFPIFASSEDAVREPRIAAETRLLPEHLQQPTWRYQLHPLPFLQTCGFLDEDNRCGIYSTRPDVCRNFAAGNPQCQDARARKGLPPLQGGSEP
jgi:Fe-S-cluster containining protein